MNNRRSQSTTDGETIIKTEGSMNFLFFILFIIAVCLGFGKNTRL